MTISKKELIDALSLLRPGEKISLEVDHSIDLYQINEILKGVNNIRRRQGGVSVNGYFVWQKHSLKIEC